MINKIFKRIHNKYSTLFKFIFFLRHLFGIFFIAVILFLSIPYFFDYKKQDIVIKKYLLESYGLRLDKYVDIKFKSLPKPHLEIFDANLIEEKKDTFQINTKKLILYPKLLNIYNFKNLETNKIILIKNKILLDDKDLKPLIRYIYNLRNRLAFRNLNLKIIRRDETLINLEKINFANYGYNKNIATGEIFKKKFKIIIKDNYNEINFKLLKTGINADVRFNEKKQNSSINGIFKSKLLNTKLKFNFTYDDKKLKIYNSYFRNRNLSFNSKSVINHHPFFNINSIFNIDNINTDILKEINFNQILNSKYFIGKINIKNEINFKSKKFSNNLIDDLNLNINLAYGKLFYDKKLSIGENFFTCKGEVNLLSEFPILYFDCSITSDDKKKFLKEFSIRYKARNELLILNFKGYINILNKKINFENINMNKDYEASKEDLKYFKKLSESIFFEKKFIDIFNLKKIRKFILEIS
jgi:hypothetical protein